MKLTALFALATFALNANAASEVKKPGPEAVAINLMAQFYDVQPEAVQIEVRDRTAQAATVIATAPGGHSCKFGMVPAPTGSPAPHGWLIGSTECERE